MQIMNGDEIGYYCSNLEFKEIDSVFFYENFRPYIDRFTFKRIRSYF